MKTFLSAVCAEFSKSTWFEKVGICIFGFVCLFFIASIVSIILSGWKTFLMFALVMGVIAMFGVGLYKFISVMDAIADSDED